MTINESGNNLDALEFGKVIDRLAEASKDRKIEGDLLEKLGRPPTEAHMTTLIRVLESRMDGAARAADLLIYARWRHAELIRIATRSQAAASRVVAGCPDIQDRRLDLVAAGIGSKVE